MGNENIDFHSLLDEAAAFHGHFCGGQIVGVRMALAGLKGIGLKYPEAKQNRDFVVFVEIGRCATDAIMTITGRRAGRRTLKILDYGKMAATFVDLKTGNAVRVAAKNDFRQKADSLAESRFAALDDRAAQLEALKSLSEEELLTVHKVGVSLRPEDMPGPPSEVVVCEKCGEEVFDGRQVDDNGMVLCRPCQQGCTYYALPG